MTENTDNLNVPDVSRHDAGSEEKDDFNKVSVDDSPTISAEVINARKHLIWMRWIVFAIVILWCLLSLGTFAFVIYDNFFNGGKLFCGASVGVFVLTGLLVAVPTVMLSFVTCSVFRRMDRDSDSSHSDKSDKIVSMLLRMFGQ